MPKDQTFLVIICINKRAESFTKVLPSHSQEGQFKTKFEKIRLARKSDASATRYFLTLL